MIQQINKKCLFCGQLYLVDKHDICKKCVFNQHSAYSPHYVKPISSRRNALSNPEIILNFAKSYNLLDKTLLKPESLNIIENPELIKKISVNSIKTSDPIFSRKNSLYSVNDFELVDIDDALDEITPKSSQIPDEFSKNFLQIIAEKRKKLENDDAVSYNILKHTKSEPIIKLNDIIHIPNRRSTIGNPSILKNTLNQDKTDFDKKKDLKVLQIKITDAKQKLKETKKALEQYSVYNSSPSHAAARIEYSLAEKEVEEACRKWCQACRS